VCDARFLAEQKAAQRCTSEGKMDGVMQIFDWQRKIFSTLAFAAILLVAANLPLVIVRRFSRIPKCSHYNVRSWRDARSVPALCAEHFAHHGRAPVPPARYGEIVRFPAAGRNADIPEARMVRWPDRVCRQHARRTRAIHAPGGLHLVRRNGVCLFHEPQAAGLLSAAQRGRGRYPVLLRVFLSGLRWRRAVQPRCAAVRKADCAIRRVMSACGTKRTSQSLSARNLSFRMVLFQLRRLRSFRRDRPCFL
jgi:hypothetical protein